MNPPEKKIRSPWPIAITTWFVVFISAIGVFVSWAVKQKMDLVRPDYYAEEILHQRRIDAVQRTKPFAKEIAVAYDEQARSLLLRVPASHAIRDFTGTAHLYRPSDASLDRHEALRPDAAGTQRLDARTLKPGLWKVRLEWKSAGEEFAFDQSVVVGD